MVLKGLQGIHDQTKVIKPHEDVLKDDKNKSFHVLRFNAD
jgi:hypothetical protein